MRVPVVVAKCFKTIVNVPDGASIEDSVYDYVSRNQDELDDESLFCDWEVDEIWEEDVVEDEIV